MVADFSRGEGLLSACAVHMHMELSPSAVADMVCAWWALASELPVLARATSPNNRLQHEMVSEEASKMALVRSRRGFNVQIQDLYFLCR